MNKHESINYVEYPCCDLEKTKIFFSAVFGWKFKDFGPEYAAFSKEESGLDGGFFKANLKNDVTTGAALIVFFSNDLESTQQKIEYNGGFINEAIFSFPGGRRFHFKDPSENEFAVWSDK
ncbi:MAG: VOC family protein [Saccharospirillaceae bacterium]|nr:VOC family protein [Pseudomonadales bacterium]NRB80745.1 VOC family protein [Saccharospirillaceae bacterium]